MKKKKRNKETELYIIMYKRNGNIKKILYNFNVT